ncbi:MAG: hypothetical protein R3325_14260 [Thermoanaerobaculia bacterium]|nr:hypothetical protein [Thermoanaerobaculia bacterium]
MKFPTRRMVPLALIAALLATAPLGATTLLQMNLGDLTQRADRIFRGTVIDVTPGTVSVGGAELPTTTYRLRVEESFKGDADLVKGDQAMIEVQMIGSIKKEGPRGDLVKFSAFRDVPRLTMGGDYLLFTTAPSAAGLSTTVGLAQGAFTVFVLDRQEYAVNGFNNGGLGLDSAGPALYDDLSAKINALLGN